MREGKNALKPLRVPCVNFGTKLILHWTTDMIRPIWNELVVRLGWACFWPTNAQVRATSHTRLKAHDHCNLRALIGGKGGDRPSSLHTRRWRPKGPKKTSWIKSVHGILHGGLWIRFHGFQEFLLGPPSKGGLKANFRIPWLSIKKNLAWQISGQIARQFVEHIPRQTNTTKLFSQIDRVCVIL
jgi:hypothetical protein